jgi:FliI/YscN family ATPase
VIGFSGSDVLLMALEEVDGLQAGDKVVSRGNDLAVPVAPSMLGRVLDSLGRPMDGGPPLNPIARYQLHRAPVNPMQRAPIEDAIATGIKAIDGMLTCGIGQRIGIFGGSGVGKSTLLGSMVRQSLADVCVVALIGERNREVREFIDHDLGSAGLARAVLVVATSDRPAPLRVQAAFAACAIAEYFRDEGAKVLLVMDSVTRLAMAQREIGLAAGEPPSQKGYTPSVFQLLPRLFERAGNFPRGSITGFFTVLVEGDDLNEPISDAVRSILDGHIVLSRRLASKGHYPPIDVLESVSRLANRLTSAEHRRGALQIREALAAFRNAEDLIQLGAYTSGANPQLDAAVRELQSIEQFLKQSPGESSGLERTVETMMAIARRLAA